MVKCPKCGKYEIMDRLCERCFVEQNPIVKGFKSMELEVCAICDSFRLLGRWKSFEDFSVAVEEFVKSRTEFSKEAVIEMFKTKFSLPPYKRNVGVLVKAEIDLKVIGRVHENQKKSVSEDYLVPLTVKFVKCSKCSKLGTQYFEGILQVRNVNVKVLDFIDRELSKQKSKGIIATQVKKVRNGFDYYLTSQTYTSTLGNLVFKRFGGDINSTAKLFTKDKLTSKNVYRVYFLVRLPDFGAKDIIRVKDKLIVVESVKGRNVYGKFLISGKQTIIDYKKKGYEIVARGEEIKKAIVSKVKPEIEVIHPETYQSVEVRNKRDVKLGKNVDVVVINSKVYLI
ncbi:hypothetical protein KY330_03180 [Candidatus Woesearchaeota archaeon]|nr:hypothetical protein [Candidatus Woesearchaeota archaeon]